MNVYEVGWFIPDNLEKCKESFVDNGSIEYKEFMKQIKLYLKDPSIVTNYDSYKIIANGIKKFIKINRRTENEKI